MQESNKKILTTSCSYSAPGNDKSIENHVDNIKGYSWGFVEHCKDDIIHVQSS